VELQVENALGLQIKSNHIKSDQSSDRVSELYMVEAYPKTGRQRCTTHVDFDWENVIASWEEYMVECGHVWLGFSQCYQLVASYTTHKISNIKGISCSGS